MLLNTVRMVSASMVIYLETTEVTAAQPKVEDNFTVGNFHSSNYKLTENMVDQATVRSGLQKEGL